MEEIDLFCPNMSLNEVNAVSMLGLAHVGDGVYELLTRTSLCAQGNTTVGKLHKLTVERVNAPAQARAAALILPLLTEEEQAVYRRGKNAKVNYVPQRATLSQYHAATGLEALFGWLYLLGRTERVKDFFSYIENALNGEKN